MKASRARPQHDSSPSPSRSSGALLIDVTLSVAVTLLIMLPLLVEWQGVLLRERLMAQRRSESMQLLWHTAAIARGDVEVDRAAADGGTAASAQLEEEVQLSWQEGDDVDALRVKSLVQQDEWATKPAVLSIWTAAD